MNIHTEYLIKWYRSLLVDICNNTGVSLDAPVDISYEWLTIGGPLLEKQVLAYIEGNRLEQPNFPEWVKPLWEAFVLHQDARYLRSLRQLLLFYYKVEHEPTQQQIEAAQAVFESTDAGIGAWDDAFSTLSRTPVFASARRIVGSVIYRIHWSEITPSHGPGAVYPSRDSSQKSCFRTLYSSIIEKYPYDQFFCGIPSFWQDVMVDESIWKLDEKETIQAKLTAVPKDSRGPRLICVHPAEAIWIQQGQRLLLESAITRSPLTRGKINFTDQSVNGKLALTSSESGYFCTLDLKEASDRLSKDLIKYLFGTYAYSWLSCARADTIKLLDGRVVDLKKWAPMGNALCFPVQSLVFFSLVHAGIRSHYGTDCNDIYVFGDDILFPVKYYEGAIRGLVLAGLVPNMDKTFRKGFFRESCGVDAYRGKDVTPLRVKKQDITSAQDALSLVDLAKRLRKQGYEHCSASIYSSIRKEYGYLPLSNNSNSQGFVEYVDRDLGWLLRHEPKLRYRNSVCQWSVPCRMVTNRSVSVSKGDWYHLQDSLLRVSKLTSCYSDRGTEYASPYSVRLTYGWSDCSYQAH
jgi:hypothetical protein